MEFYTAVRKDEMQFFAMWMVLEGIILKHNESEKDIQIPDDLTPLWSIKNETREQRANP